MTAIPEGTSTAFSAFGVREDVESCNANMKRVHPFDRARTVDAVRNQLDRTAEQFVNNITALLHGCHRSEADTSPWFGDLQPLVRFKDDTQT